jgi:fructose-1,6-bisphosphatase/inositol monophosphatase family enzyme
MPGTDDLALAASLVQAAGQLAADMLRKGLTVHHKTSISDVVSAADHAAEELVVRQLRAQRPDDGIVGEEGTSEAGDGRNWYVDPVDGTYNFLSGLPTWCAAIALGTTPQDDPLLGAVYHPAADELWVGGDGAPTTCNGTELTPIADAALHEVSLATYLHPTTLPDPAVRDPMLRAMAGAATVRMLGSGSIEMAAVSAGRLGATMQVDSLPWDWLPGAALVRAAGGAARVVDIGAHRWHLSGPERVVDQLAALLRGE